MECGRCHGLMVPESAQDMAETSGCDRMYGWRCLNCGELVDPVITQRRILAHSRSSRVPQVPKIRARGTYPVGVRVRTQEHNPPRRGEYLYVETRKFGFGVQKR